MGMESRVRCFVAIELDRKIVSRVMEFRSALEKRGGNIRWVAPKNLHLTLKFLGEVDDTVLADICSVVSSAAAEFDPFDFEVADCGCFGSAGSARVLWLGVKNG